MRIAVCMAGQFRTWEKCHESWKNLLDPYGGADFFCHMWDYNCLPMNVPGGVDVEVSVSKEEQQCFIDTIKPTRIVIESKKSFPIHNEGVNKPLIPFENVRSQFYSLWQSCLLKQEYEKEHNFQYDVVLRIRPDTYFPKQANVIPKNVKPNSIYLQKYNRNLNNDFGTSPDHAAYNDKFFMGGSEAFNKFSELYCSLSYLEEDDVFDPNYARPQHVTPEWILGYYAANRNIQIELLKPVLILTRRGEDFPSELRRGEIF